MWDEYFWCEGCLLYRCLLPLSLVWASHYTLEEGIQMQLLVPSHWVLSSGGGSYMPLEHAMGTEAACDCTGSPEGQNHWLETCPEAQRRAVVVAHNHLWSPRGSGGLRLLLELTQAASWHLRAHKGKKVVMASSIPALAHHPHSDDQPLKQTRLLLPTSSGAVADSSILRFLHSPPHFTPWIWSLTPELLYQAPNHTGGLVFRGGECRGVALTVQVSLRSSRGKNSCCILQGSKAPPLFQLISPWGDFPGCKNLSSVTAPSQEGRFSFLSYFFAFLFSFVLLGYVEIFSSFQRSEVFCQHSVDILWQSFHM